MGINTKWRKCEGCVCGRYEEERRRRTEAGREQRFIYPTELEGMGPDGAKTRMMEFGISGVREGKKIVYSL